VEASRRNELKAIAQDFVAGRMLALEAAVALATFEDEVPGELRSALLPITAVASETDDIPLGGRRILWHPDVRAREDQKHDEAQAWAEPIVRQCSEKILKLL
jgi:hypothetical protein